MRYIILTLALLISFNSFGQEYLSMNKKGLRIEHQKKLKLIDSLSQELNISNAENLQKLNSIDSLSQKLLLLTKKNQTIQSKLNDSDSELKLTIDSLINSNLSNSQFEAKLLTQNNELTQLVVKMKDLVSQDSLKSTIINSLKKENEELLITVNDSQRELSQLYESIKKFSAQKIDLDKWAGITLLPLSSCVSKIDVYQTRYWEFFKGYNDGKYYLGEFEVAYEIESILYNQFSDVFTVNMTGKVTSEGDEWQVDPYKVTIKRLNGKFYINSGINSSDETTPYVACENVEQVWGMD